MALEEAEAVLLAAVVQVEGGKVVRQKVIQIMQMAIKVCFNKVKAYV